jgi:hypothetical protein
LQRKKKVTKHLLKTSPRMLHIYLFFYLFYKLKIYNLFYNDNDIYNTSSHWQ